MEHRMEEWTRDITSAPGTTSVSVADLFFHTELCRSMGPVAADNWLRSTLEANSRTRSFKGLRRRRTTPMDRQLCVHVEQNMIPRTPSSLSELSSAATSRSSSPVRLRQRSSSRSDQIKEVLGILQTEDMQVSAACPRPSEPAATSCNNEHDFDDGSNINMAMLLQQHSDKAYLLFTDAAHELLDQCVKETSRVSSPPVSEAVIHLC